MNTSAELRIFLLGSPRVEDKAGEIKLPGRKSLALLSYLALHAPHAFTREHLAGYFWPSLPDKDARNNLRVAVARIRKSSSTGSHAVFEADRLNVRINPDYPIWVDVCDYWAVEKSIEQHKRGIDTFSSELYTRQSAAVGLYSGEFMEGFYLSDCEQFEEWQSTIREQVRVSITRSLGELSTHSEALGDYTIAERYTRQHLILDPFDEVAHRRLMTLMDSSGKRSAAIEHYELLKKRLQLELGIQPDNHTRELYERLEQQADDHIDTGYCVSSSGPATAASHNLPVDKSPYIGNKATIAQLLQHLQTQRLITLTGIGGIGKTRLAIQLGRQCLTQFPDGVRLVRLAAVESVSEIVTAISNALHIETQPGVEPLYTLVQRLLGKRTLLILDNFEHLFSGREIILTLLERVESMSIVVTSRQKLQLSAEAVFPVTGLSFDTQESWRDGQIDSASDAIELFLDAARRSRLDFQANAKDLESIEKITRLVKGHPLAIVLAAGWLGSLSCSDIHEELLKDLGILETQASDVPERQRSVMAAFNHSWELLSEEDQQLFSTLSVFRGGFDRHASQQISGASLMQLSRLVNMSLIEYLPDTSRYELHQLMRQFAEQKLQNSGLESTMADRHSEYYLQETRLWSHAVLDAYPIESCTRFNADFDNIQTAWYRSVQLTHNPRWTHAISSLRVLCLLSGRLHDLLDMLEPVLPLIADDGTANDSSNTKLQLLLALGVAYRYVKGYFAPELFAIFNQAYSLVDELDNSAELFVVLYGKWSFNITRAKFNENLIIIDQWRERLDAIDKDTVTDPYVVDACFVVNMLEGPNLQCLGSIPEARKIMTTGLKLENPARHTALMSTYGLNFSVSGRYWLAINECISGYISASDHTLEQASAIAEREDDPLLKMFAAFAHVTVYTIRAQPELIKANVEVVRQLLAEHRIFELFGHHANLYEAYADSLLGDKTALDRLLSLCDDDKGVPYYQIFDTQLLAGVMIRAGRSDEALTRLDAAMFYAEETGMQIYASESLRIKAEAKRVIGETQEAQTLYEASVLVAKTQQCRLYELRSLTSQCNALKATAGDSAVVAKLQAVLGTFDDEDAIPDIVAARRAIEN